MSGYTKCVTKSFTFEGDEFTVTFHRMKRKHLMQIYPEIMQYTKRGEDSDNAELVTSLLDKIYGFIEEYITCIVGLKDADGNDVSTNEFFSELYFMDASSKVAMAVLEASLGPLVQKSIS